MVHGEKMYATFNQIRAAVGEAPSRPERTRCCSGHQLGRGMMVEIAFKARVRGRIRAVWLGLTITASVVVQLGHAQNLVLGPTPGITTLSGTNAAQQTMGQSINTFCPTVSGIATTPNQIDLKTICSAMIGNARQLQGQSPASSYGLDANGLK